MWVIPFNQYTRQDREWNADDADRADNRRSIINKIRVLDICQENATLSPCEISDPAGPSRHSQDTRRPLKRLSANPIAPSALI
jgi:hypothetical protein